jgi:hypothetical protein
MKGASLVTTNTILKFPQKIIFTLKTRHYKMRTWNQKKQTRNKPRHYKMRIQNKILSPGFLVPRFVPSLPFLVLSPHFLYTYTLVFVTIMPKHKINACWKFFYTKSQWLSIGFSKFIAIGFFIFFYWPPFRWTMWKTHLFCLQKCQSVATIVGLFSLCYFSPIMS